MSHGTLATLPPLVGRDREVALVTQRLAETRLVTITGPGGAGKTRLALEVIADWERQGISVRFVDLSGATDVRGAAAQIAHVLGALETAERDTVDALIAGLKDGQTLLALDNLEQIDDIDPFLVRLLSSTSELLILATSRVPLGIASEREVGVGSLELPADETPAAVEESAAGALFLARARAIGRLEVLGPDDARDVARLCSRLEGLPLALELAAARTRILSPGSVLRRLERHEAVLGSGSDVGDRHRSLEAVLDWSFELLSEDQRTVLMSLVVCVGGFDLPMAAALSPGLNVLSAIESLVAHGLAVVEPDVGGEPRFRLLETIRASALRRLPADRHGELSRLHAARMLELVLELGARVRGREALVAMRQLDADADNVRAALDWAEAVDPPTGLKIAEGATDYWRMRGRLRSAHDHLQRLLDRVPDATKESTRALAALLSVEVDLHGPVKARPLAEEVVRLAQASGDRVAELRGLNELVYHSITTEDASELDALGGRLAELADGLDEESVRFALAARAGIAAILRDRSEIEVRNEAIALARAVGDAVWEGTELSNIAAAHLDWDEPREAKEAAQSALTVLRPLGAGPYLPWALGMLGSASARTGYLADAAFALLEGIGLAVELGSSVQKANMLLAAMAFALASGDGELVGRLWGAAEAAHATGGSVIQEADRRIAQRQLGEAGRLVGAVKLELATRAGGMKGMDAMLGDLRDRLGEPQVASGDAQISLRHGELTPREVEVLTLLAGGRTDREIADTLFISTKTVSVHVSNAKSKLAASSRLELAIRARELGLRVDR